MKYLLKIISLILVGTLTMSTLQVNASVVNPVEIHKIDLGDGLEVSIEDSSETRIVLYYENDILKQKAILYKESGDIYYHDLSLQNDLSRNYSANDNISYQSYTKKYNIEDFKNNMYITDKAIIAKSSSPTFTYLKSKTFVSAGQTYTRYLYGYKDEVITNNAAWNFAAGLAVSIVLAAIGFIPGINAYLAAFISVAGGTITTAIFVTEYVKELFWVHKFSQTSPTILEFVCSINLIYEKQRRVIINDQTIEWETFYTEPDWSIEHTRDDILTNPGLYL